MAGSTPIYGFPYPTSTDLVADYPAMGQDLATDVETVISGLGSGLNLVTPTSIANSGGSASVSGGEVTFSGVTSISVNGAFSAAYENYRIETRISLAASPNTVRLRLRAAGTDSSASYDFKHIYGSYGTTSSGADINGTSQTSARIDIGYGGFIPFDIGRPFLAATSFAVGQWTDGTYGYGSFGIFHNVATSYDGLTIFPSGSNISGTIRIYGYKNS